MKNSIKITAIVSLLTMSMTAALADMPKVINVAYVKAPFNIQNIVIKNQFLLEKAFEMYGTKIVWHTISSGAKQAQAMAAGSLDVSAVMNTASLLSANGAGNKVVIVNGVAHPADVFAIVGKPGQTWSINDLKGKKIAGPRGTVLHQLMVAALVKEGFSVEDVEFISMDQPSAMSALMAGHVDAALLAASAVIKAQNQGCKVITTAKDLVNVNLVMTASGNFAKNYPEALELIQKVQRDSLQWVKSNWTEAMILGAEEHGITLEDAKRLASWSNYYDTLTTFDLKGLKLDQDFLVENGLMRQRVNVESIVLPIAMK
ncbi:ABC transporter substrate-binding protein [Escherichia coli]|uniref:ABC transporter substrate-binding protein n=1 Tax=Escherichia coli TaxID=562 RepID=A0A828P7Z8_ECOLX|nr:NrtA/SsuA/CpmA family ABC transporter substrate-binding protein [Escherichia coli]EER6665822.1 ABC transporter substrate-binding protein [Escherichia coli]EET7765590.1 ABC transporter substrate-binding protein [Escherichia coli]EEZ2004947.1 ABC transporter substrate-binding protein [Escherichia coli]EFA9656301.1 ABC transporter substrate-binding protein [Escherichia coli]EFE8777825.1 ABC transporter substrate-binding protein [Escherichia coli]